MPHLIRPGSLHASDQPPNGLATWPGLGGLAALHADAATLLAAPAAKSSRAKSVILIFNCGAPSHIDLWDPKPEAPTSTRGKYQPISTTVPDIQFSELLPRMAQRADKLAVVRSVYHQHSSHNSGMNWSIVGRPYPIDSTLINPSRIDVPSFGTLTGWLAQRDGYSGAVPPYVITPRPHCDSLLYITPGQFGSCLGPRFDPLVLNGDPNDDAFQVPNLGMAAELTGPRLQKRSELLREFERHGGRIETATAGDMDTHRAKAFADRPFRRSGTGLRSIARAGVGARTLWPAYLGTIAFIRATVGRGRIAVRYDRQWSEHHLGHAQR